MKTFEASRPAVAAMAVGVSRAALEFATDYAATRVQFGRPIGQNQAGSGIVQSRSASDASWRA
jgi:alkylation response protein AidB-like acyl-CoA dehydrogenase